MKIRAAILVLSLGILASCTGSTPAGDGGDESPLAPPTIESPLSPPETDLPSCLTLIEPVSNTVCGYVISQIDGLPAAGRAVYLAEALFSSDGSIVLAALDEETAPQGVTDEDGMFYVIDVPPNLYFVELGEFPRPVMLKEPDNPSNDLIVDWRESEGAIDLGVIQAPVLSLQQP